MEQSSTLHEIRRPGSVLEVFKAFLVLGLTSFGGPVAHLGYFRDEFVVAPQMARRAAYADLVALCQFTPGPASSKVGIAIGLTRAGLPGAFAAWVGFTLPSAIALMLFAYGVEDFRGDLDAGWLHGLKIVAVAVVAQAVWGMARNLCAGRAALHGRRCVAAVTLRAGPRRSDRWCDCARRAGRLAVPSRGKRRTRMSSSILPFGKAAGAVVSLPCSSRC